MKKITACILMFAFSSVVSAQTYARVNLSGGVSLAGQIKNDTVPVKTKYGVLQVPIGDIYSISFGLHYEDGQKEVIESLIKQLDNPSFKLRDEATKSLIQHGQHVIPFLRTLPSNAEANKRMEAIESEIRSKTKNFLLEYDTIQTRFMEIKGEIQLSTFELSCHHKELGTIKPKLVNIQSLFVRSSFQTIDLEVRDDWLMTTFYVAEGSTVNIAATGLIDLHPASGGQYTSSPKGYGSTTGKGGRWIAGSLMGRIGNGEEFYIGESFSATSSKSGTLYLRIIDNPWNSPNVGRYTINIKNE